MACPSAAPTGTATSGRMGMVARKRRFRVTEISVKIGRVGRATRPLAILDDRHFSPGCVCGLSADVAPTGAARPLGSAPQFIEACSSVMLHIYNTLSRTKEPFKPVEPGRVRMYVCGMTVYDYCHLGHARMLVTFDVVQRWLRASGLSVSYVRNITDIDDKIIRRAVETGRRLGEVTEYYIEAMHADERALGVQPPDHEPR